MKTHNILIAEDDKKQAELLSILLSGDVKFHISSMVESYEDAVKVLDSENISLLIVDIDLKGKKNGIDIIRYAVNRNSDILVLVYTIHADSTVLFDAIKAGAGGYILKGTPASELLKDIERVCNGDVPISPQIARKILSYFKETLPEQHERLTERETELIKLSDKGYSHKQIAEMLNLSTHTVYTHFKNIYYKLQVNNRADAAAKARSLSII